MSIDVSAAPNVAAFTITNGSTVQLTLLGVNVLQSGANRAGLEVGSGNTVTIDGTGSLEATGGSIDASSSGSGERIVPRPTNGFDNVFLNTLKVQGISGVQAVSSLAIAGVSGGYGIHDVFTDTAGTLYFWLPKSTGNEEVVAWFGPDDYSASYTRKDDDSNARILRLHGLVPASVAPTPTLGQRTLLLLIGALALVAAPTLRRRSV